MFFVFVSTSYHYTAMVYQRQWCGGGLVCIPSVIVVEKDLICRGKKHK